jgi:hypothetical protein
MSAALRCESDRLVSSASSLSSFGNIEVGEVQDAEVEVRVG